MPDLELNARALFDIALILAFGLLAIQLLRIGARMAADRILARDADEAEPSTLDLGAVEREKRIRTAQGLAVRIGAAVIVIVITLMILSVFGIQIAPALAGLGVVGIAVGLGAQTLVKDWLAGIFILTENQFSRGDVVRIAGVAGVVEEFSLRRTVVRDLDGVVHSVPNGTITVASNLTRLWANVNLDVQISYESDLEAAVAVLDELGQELAGDETWGPKILEAPKVLRVDELGDSGVTLKILGKVRPAEQWGVAGELRRRILARFGQARIEIPYPHRTIIQRAGDSSPDGDGSAAATAAAPADAASEASED